jgi:hypothetical protein
MADSNMDRALEKFCELVVFKFALDSPEDKQFYRDLWRPKLEQIIAAWEGK